MVQSPPRHRNMSPFTLHDRQRRIVELSQEWGIVLPPPAGPLARPQHPPSFWSPADDQVAEDLLQRRASEIAQLKPKSGLTRAFSSNNLKKGKHWDPRDIVEVLTSWVGNAGSPGVAEALINKLSAAGVDLSGMQKQKGTILNRRRSMETSVDRTRLLKQAVEGNQHDMVQVLLPHADPLALDACLPVAMRHGNAGMVELLLRYGANSGQTAEGQDTFRQACAVHGQSPMIGLILQSEGRPSPLLISQSLSDAARAGCLDTVMHLSRSVADCDYNQAEALRLAVSQGRRDIAMAIVMGKKSPQRPGLDQAFRLLVEHPSLNPNTKLQIAELLLCAGAEGDVVSEALEKSCEMQFFDMANLLAMYGASVEYNSATVLKTAISKGQMDLVVTLLNDRTSLHPALASSCVPLIPKHATIEERYSLFNMLLRKGANGKPLDEGLIHAAEAGDLSSVELLLSPFFPGRQINGSGASNGAAQERHAMASANYKGGEALRTAVLRADCLMTEKILASQPSPETLTAVFPLTRKLSATDRYQMVDLFLKRSLSGQCLHAALQDAINEPASQRDDALIKLLLQHDADVNYNNGSGLAALIKQQDVALLAALLQKASPQTAAARVPDAAEVADPQARHDIMSLLFNSGASIGSNEVAAALLRVLTEKPVDMALLRLLLQRGGADVNLLDGAIVKQAVVNADPKVLELLFREGKPSPSSVTLALSELASQSSTESKAWKLKVILSRSSRNEDLNFVLVHEVQSLLREAPDRTSLATLKELLESGADPNGYKAAALCHAVIGANTQIIDMLFACRLAPTSASLGSALPHVLRITDRMDRLALTTRLVNAGAHPREINRALTHSVGSHSDDISLLNVLAIKADASDGEAMALAVSKESPEILELLLDKTKHTIEVRNTALNKAMEINNRSTRTAMCQRLLGTGISPEVASNALLIAARDGDLNLGDILMAHGANISSNNGQAIIEACRGGSVDVLKVLLRSDKDTSTKTLEEGFQAATEVRDLNKRATIFEQLLKRGVSGELVDTQLESAARSGDDGQGILKVLLAAGADPNFNNGEAVVAATRSAFIGSVELLLGLWDDGGSQKKASQPTMARALKASWQLNRDNRYRIINDLLKARMQTTGDLHIALNEAVNEEDPEERLVKLLLDHGASPLTNGCKTLIDAIQNFASSSLGLLLQRPVPQEEINRAFNNAFTKETFDKWYSTRGLETARMLLDKGARGDGISGALVLVLDRSTPESADLANQFVDLLVSHGPDVDFNNGELLQRAASNANVEWTRKLLELRPSAATLSLAFQCIFDTALTQDGVLELFQMFTEYRDGDTCVDVMSLQQGEPVLVRAIKQYPRSTTILSTLLDAGYYHDQITTHRFYPEIEEEESMTLLAWAIAQPQKRVSTAVIQLLVERGAKVNTVTQLSLSTPLMLAIQTRRPDIVKMLLLEGAEVDIVDSRGRSPLSMTTDMGGDIAIQMMTSLLAAEPSRDDGSLHNAARDLNLQAVKVLVQSDHDPDFPSPLHEGRSALGELCLRGGQDGEMTAERERAMQKVMAFLVDSGSDLSIKENGKSLLHLCFDAADPVVASRALLKSGMWKHVNKPFNYYVEADHTYSPTMYVTKILKQTDFTQQIMAVLRANRAKDVFYVNSGPQPDDAVGLPEDIEVQERTRKARMARITEESEEFKISMARKREMASVEQQILAQKAEMEDSRRRRHQTEDINSLRSRAQLEESLSSAAYQRRLAEQRAMTDAAVGRTRAIAASEVEAEESRQRKALEWENRLNIERTGNVRALSAIKIGEREELERIERGAEGRIKSRLEAQRKLVDSQEKLAKRLADGPGGTSDARRQIGYVTEIN